MRALEEGDGSVSGSSPCSDSSQPASQDGMRRLMSKKGKWKMFVRATSPESTSRSSSKTGRETPENGETGNSCFILNFRGVRYREEILVLQFFVPSSKRKTALLPFYRNAVKEASFYFTFSCPISNGSV